MWSEDDLRVELAALGHGAEARGAAVADQVLTQVRGRAGGRRGARMIAVAAAAAVAVAIPATIGGLRLFPPDRVGVTAAASPSAPATAEPDRPPFSVTVASSPVAGFVVYATRADAHGQVIGLLSPEHPRWPAQLSLMDPGALPPAVPDGASGVTVGGRPGYLALKARQYDLVSGPLGPVLQWQYRDDAWAVLQLDLAGGPADGTVGDLLLAIATGLRFTAPVPLAVPVRLHRVTPGLRLAAVDAAYRVAGLGLDAVTLECVDPASGDQLEIRLSPGSAFGPDQKPGAAGVRPDRVVAGHPAHYAAGALVVDFGDLSVNLFSPSGAGQFSQSTLDDIVAGMTFAAWADRSSWYDAATILP